MPRQREAPAVKTDHIMIDSTTVNNSVPQFKYHIVNRQGQRVESNLPDQEIAEACVTHLRSQQPHETFTVEQEQIFTKESLRLGRDPDLH
jgi:hypothetical protein